MGEAENVEVCEVPVRYISIEFANHEDGGGISVMVRLDGVEPERILEITMRLLERVNGKNPEKKNDPREVA